MSKIYDVWKLYKEKNEEGEISKKLGIKRSSVSRYIRMYKQKHPIERSPNILLFDIETSPMIVLVWGLYKQKISPTNIIKDWSILSWSAKWLHSNEVLSMSVSSKEARDRTDKSVIKELWNLFDKADIIVAHNARRFDIRKTNVRFIINGLKPPMPYQIVDTYIESKKNFAFSTFKLNDLNRILGKTQKIKTEYSLWKRCVGIECGSKEQETALDEMVAYNRQDVLSLEELYLEILPWIKSHPNLGVFPNSSGNMCSNCQSELLDWNKYSYYTTPMGRYRTYRCGKCGAINRSRLSDLSSKEKAYLKSSTAR